jgi:hypothetical protein
MARAGCSHIRSVGYCPWPDLLPLGRGARDRPDLLENFPYLVYWTCNFDNLLLLRLTGEHDAVLPLLEPIAEGEIFTLYRIRSPANCTRGNPL